MSLSTINRWAKELGWVNSNNHSKSLYQQILILKNQRLKWREIAQKLSISEGKAKMCFKRHHQSL